jgi:hypothetical protein
MLSQGREAKGELMVVASAAALLLAQAATAGPVQPAQAKSPDAAVPDAPPASVDADRCPPPSGDGRVIVVCTQRPQGYRLNPDVMEAKRELHSGGRPVRPGGKGIPDCAHVGPAPCVTAGINLIAAGLTAAEMASRLAKGQEIGSMFVTDPHPNEYQLYLEAKHRREAEEAEKAAAKKAKEKAAQQKAADPQPAGN